MLGFILMKKALGSLPAFFGSAAWVSTLGLLLIWENYPEEYALPLQFGSFYLFFEAEASQRVQRRRWLVMALIGVLTSACFLLKSTLVGSQIAIILVLLWRTGLSKSPFSRFLLDLASFGAGILLLLVPAAGYFWSRGILGEALDEVVRYNLSYSAASAGDRFLSVLSGLGGLPALSGAPALALLEWVRICRQTVRGSTCLNGAGSSAFAYVNSSESRAGSPTNSNEGRDLLSALAFIGLPVELLLVAVPGRSYGYYFTAWLPIIGVLCAVFAHRIMGGNDWPASRVPHRLPVCFRPCGGSCASGSTRGSPRYTGLNHRNPSRGRSIYRDTFCGC